MEVVTAGGVKLGYVPRRAAREVAVRLDADDEVRAMITGFLPVPAPGERLAIPEGLVRTWCHPGEPIWNSWPDRARARGDVLARAR